MKTIVVVERPENWSLRVPGATVVSAKEYLTDTRWTHQRRAIVFNLCRHYGYQSMGYYVSLLAAARNHRPLPSVSTIQDLRLTPIVRIASEDLHSLVQRSLSSLRSESFELSIYFGRNMAKRYDRLAQALFNQFPAPFLRAGFAWDGDWELRSVRAIAAAEIPESHWSFVVQRATDYIGGAPTRRPRPRRTHRYDLAILTNEDDASPPSDPVALRRFARAAAQLDIATRFVGKDDYARLAEFDGLFVRETTAVNHHTYRFARRAEALGLVVIDDPQSIVRCTNKVYQAESFALHGIAHPKTTLIHRGTLADAVATLPLPCVLKKPDSAFSQGVVRVDTADDLSRRASEMLDESEMIVAQEFVASEFDWRIGVLDGRPLYAAKYFMARGHWQIIATQGAGQKRYGRVEPLPLKDVPRAAVELAVRSAALVGTGLYGVDVKQVGKRFLVVEVNDNPTIESGCEDAVAKDGLYQGVMRYFRERFEMRGGAGARP